MSLEGHRGTGHGGSNDCHRKNSSGKDKRNTEPAKEKAFLAVPNECQGLFGVCVFSVYITRATRWRAGKRWGKLVLLVGSPGLVVAFPQALEEVAERAFSLLWPAPKLALAPSFFWSRLTFMYTGTAEKGARC
jgi:hypothetical protein